MQAPAEAYATFAMSAPNALFDVMPLVKKALAPKRTAPQAAAVKKSRKSYSILFKAEVVVFVKAQRDLKAKAPLAAALEKFKTPLREKS
ncbi:hypothetical protein QFC21_006512 [Naganishia friedmannii]|uniref:Uncharacterized protein n=1 Tax=Naganishia friedmannii TaxID=89922 RepID=A0ACC2V2N4_9TREE|nr:hypothetical protein QFC21_006512 [Naganishia friedmannii]